MGKVERVCVWGGGGSHMWVRGSESRVGRRGGVTCGWEGRSHVWVGGAESRVGGRGGVTCRWER